MKNRCINKNAPDYDSYGGRGISYDLRWEKLENFLKDMESTFKKGLTLDRIDNSKGYSKENCKWSTQREQQQNKRNNIYIEYLGEKHTLSEWSRILGIKRTTLVMRYSILKWNPIDCLTIPIGGVQNYV